MVEKSNEQTEAPEDDSEVEYIDDNSSFSLSPNFGKKDPWPIRASRAITSAGTTFFFDLFTALKTIIRGVM